MTRGEAPISPPVVLTIAGSDSGGGAGIQADLKTIEACGGFGTSAITSATAQNTLGVQGSHHLPVESVDAQIAAVREDFAVAAVKTGMLATGDVVDLVADHAGDLPDLVVDPVMVAASGDRLLAEEAETAYESLLAKATLVTPNADEAEVLTGVAVEDPDSAERAGRLLVDDHGAGAALVKGGHVPGDQVVDTLVTADGVTSFRHDRIDTDATHGTGCTLSSAIATHLAHGDDLVAAVGAGIDLLARAVRYNVAVGQGPGSVHHLVELRNDASRAATIDLVHALADRFREEGWNALVPATGAGLAAATPHAEEPADVAAVAGRFGPARTDADAPATEPDPNGPGANLHGEGGVGPRNATSVRFGADGWLASLLLAVRDVDPSLRLGAIVACTPTALDALEGDTRAVAGGQEANDPRNPVGGDALEAIRSAETTPIAVSFAGSDESGTDDALAAVFGESSAALLGRLATLAKR